MSTIPPAIENKKFLLKNNGTCEGPDYRRFGWLKSLGPGVVTGAADDDPSGIVTCSQAGAKFGFNTLWTLVFTYPLMAAIQIISGHIGRASGQGLASNIREHYSPALLYFLVALLFIANTINIAVDVAAMGDAMTLIAPGSPHIFALFLGCCSVLLQIFIPYRRYVRVLKIVAILALRSFPTSLCRRCAGPRCVLPRSSRSMLCIEVRFSMGSLLFPSWSSS